MLVKQNLYESKQLLITLNDLVILCIIVLRVFTASFFTKRDIFLLQLFVLNTGSLELGSLGHRSRRRIFFLSCQLGLVVLPEGFYP